MNQDNHLNIISFIITIITLIILVLFVWKLNDFSDREKKMEEKVETMKNVVLQMRNEIDVISTVFDSNVEIGQQNVENYNEAFVLTGDILENHENRLQNIENYLR